MNKDDNAFEVYLARGSNLSQRYRAEALEKPSPALDSEILTAARRTTMHLPEVVTRPWYKRWQVPLSIAAVFFFGIGVTLRTVMQEAKLSQPAPAAQESGPPPTKPDTVPAKPAVAPPPPREESATGAVQAPTQPATPDVIMGGSMQPAPADAKAKAAPDLQGADLGKAAPRVTGKLYEEQATKPAPFPTAPPVEKDESARSTRPMPEAAPSRAAGDDAVENKAGRGSSAHSLKKESPGVLSERRESAPNLERSNDDAAAVPAPPQSETKRDQAAPPAAEAEKPVTPPASLEPQLPTPSVRTDSKPQASEGPHLPEGHSPIVDGKTFRSRAASRAEPAKESDVSSGIIVEDQTEAPEVWLKRIAELRRAGKNEEADAQLKHLRERYPNFPVPEDK